MTAPGGRPAAAVRGLYAVLDPAVAAAGAADPDAALDGAVREALAGGCRVFQLRDKRSAAGALLVRARRLAGICREEGALFIVNDRLDVGLLCGADGVHLGQDDLPAAAARRIAPAGFLIGVSTHGAEEARRAEADGADYVGVGAVFGTTSKGDALAPRGAALVSEVAAAVSIPAVAIAGITRENVREVIRAGAAGFAVIADLFGGPDVRARAEAFVRIWDEEKRRP